MRVAVFRARDDGERTARRLRALGHEALLAPVLDVRPTGAMVPSGPFEGVVFTSAHGVDALAPSEAAHLLHCSCFCVGQRTAECAAALGFRNVYAGRADAGQLADVIASVLPRPVALLLVVGRDRKATIERRLDADGYDVTVLEAYEACAVDAWEEGASKAFARRQVDGALHYSRRSAELALRCATVAGVLDIFGTLRHACLSNDAAAPLQEAGFADVIVADEPNEDSLLACLGPA